MSSLAVIIPALEENAYHSEGDLAPFGDVSLLQWKLSQVKGLTNRKSIYVSTPSEKIQKMAEALGFSAIRRKEGLTLGEMIEFSLSGVKEETVLWSNVTSPFLGQRHYEAFVSAFKRIEVPHDSLLTVWPMREFVFHKGKPLNFSLHEHHTRRGMEPLYIVTNGCFVIQRQDALRHGSYIGENPYLYEVDHLSAMEIKDLKDFNMANDLIALFVENEINAQ